MLKRILILLSSILLVTAAWFAGTEALYARLMVSATNVTLMGSGSEVRIALEEENGKHLFRVHTFVGDKRASFPQYIQSLLYPTILLLAWLLFLLFTMGWQHSLRSVKWTLLPFFILHIIFLLLLTGYHFKPAARFFFDILLESFYVIALALIIIDNIRYPVFSRNTQTESAKS